MQRTCRKISQKKKSGFSRLQVIQKTCFSCPGALESFLTLFSMILETIKTDVTDMNKKIEKKRILSKNKNHNAQKTHINIKAAVQIFVLTSRLI